MVPHPRSSDQSSSRPLPCLSLLSGLALVTLLLLSCAPTATHAKKDIDLFYSLLANATHNDPTFSARVLHKRQLAQSGDPRACQPTFNIHSTPLEHRTQRRFHFIAFESSPDKCKFPNVQTQLPQLLAALDGKIVNSLHLIQAHVISFPSSLPTCELYHLPCVRYIEEDSLSYLYQAPNPQQPATPPRQGNQPSPAPQQTPGTGGGSGGGGSAENRTTSLPNTPTFPKPDYIDPQKVVQFTATHREITVPSNAPSGFQLWGLDMIDGVKNSHFSFEYTGKSAHVYVLDSGVEFSHPDFKTKQPKIDFTARSVASNAEAARVNDCSGHGTHVAGIISGSKTGVAPEAQIHMLRVIGCPKIIEGVPEPQGEASNADILQALAETSEKLQRPAVLSMSLGPSPDKATGEFPRSQALIDMLNAYTQRLQVPVVVAAGNNKSNKCSPLAEVQDIIVVGALARYSDPTYDEKSRLLRATDYSNFGECVHVYAPGSDIWSTSHKPENVYEMKKGTSQAAPFVSGIVAHMFDKFGGKQLAPGQVKELLVATYSVDRVEEVEGKFEKKDLKKAVHLPLERATIEAAYSKDLAHAATQKNRLLGLIAVIGGISGAVLLTCGLACWFRCRQRRKGPKIIGGGGTGAPFGTLSLRPMGEKPGLFPTSPTTPTGANAAYMDPSAIRTAARNELFSKSPSPSARTMPGLAPGQGQPGFAMPPSPQHHPHQRPMSPPDSLYYPPQRSLNGSQVGVRGPGSPLDPRYSPPQQPYGGPAPGYGPPGPQPPRGYEREGYGERPDDRRYQEPQRGGYQPRGYDWNRGEFDARHDNHGPPPPQHQGYDPRPPQPHARGGPLNPDQVEYAQRPPRPRPGQGHPGGQGGARPPYQGRY